MLLLNSKYKITNCGTKSSSVFNKNHDKVKILKTSKKNPLATKSQMMDFIDVSLIDFIVQKLTVDDFINITQNYIHPAIIASKLSNNFHSPRN